MRTAPQTQADLLLSRPQEDGTHSAPRLRGAWGRGELVKLRRGVFLPAGAWIGSYPSDRFRWATAATAVQLDEPTFCRETALDLHGIPLLRPPESVQVRASSRKRARPVRQPSMTGSKTSAEFMALFQASDVVRAEGWDRAAFKGFSTHHVSPAALGGGVPVERGEVMGHPVRVEPLGLALAEAVPRMPFDAAVVALDAALHGCGGRPPLSRDELEGWASWIRGTRARRFAWAKAAAFADPCSESVGESVSRVRIGELSFQRPVLQHVVAVDGRSYRCDFFWEKVGIVGEFDGWMKYRDKGGEALRREKTREDGIRSTGLRVVRWYWEDLLSPDQLRGKLLRAGVPRLNATG